MRRVPGLADGVTVTISPGGRWALAEGQARELTPPYAVRPLELAKDTPILGWSADDTMLLVGDPRFGPDDTITGLNIQTGAKTVLAHAPPGLEPALPPATLALMRRLTGRQPAAVHPLPAPEQHTWWVWSNRIVRRSLTGSYESSTGRPFTFAVDRATGRRVSLPGTPLANGFSPDGRYCWTDRSDPEGVSSSPDDLGQVVVTDLTTGRTTATLFGEQLGRFFTEIRQQGNLQWAPDGSRVARGQDTFSIGSSAYGSGQKYRVWSARADGVDLKVLYSVEESWRNGLPTTRVSACAVGGWTADGKVIVSDGGRALLSINPDTGQRTDLLRLRPPALPASLRGLGGGTQPR